MAFANGTPLPLLQQIAQGFEPFLRAQIAHYPENIFADYDFLFGYLAKCCQEDPTGGRAVQTLRRCTHLLAQFGNHTTIRFRYIHDFLYGYDWAKWVKKDRNKRCCTEPFSIEFLDAMAQRGDELKALIEANDRKYRQLAPQERFRNPFLFSREPTQEQTLLGSLAADHLIPVPGWSASEPALWQLPYAEIRQKRSVELGIPANATR